MRRTRVVVGMLALFLLFSGGSFGQDKKDSGKGRRLPPTWSKLGLSDEQRQKIYAIQSDYGSKIQELQAKLKELQKQELADMSKVLTDLQRKRLRELALEKAGADGDSKKPANK